MLKGNIEKGKRLFFFAEKGEKDNMETRKMLVVYKESLFYEKYKESYVSDKILKKVFGGDFKIHRMYGLKTYSQVHQFNVDVMKDLLCLFAINSRVDDPELLWNMIHAFYVDPDGYAIKLIGDVQCSADGLLSIKRIYRKYGMSEKAIQEYEYYRKVPIFYFPQERNGINMLRASVFGDRIDYTLFDLKRRFNMEQCKMTKAYDLPRTKKWISKIGTFENLVNILGIENIFVNENYEVYDLEKNDDSILTTYRDEYTWEWSNSYYDNLRKKIDEFMSK